MINIYKSKNWQYIDLSVAKFESLGFQITIPLEITLEIIYIYKRFQWLLLYLPIDGYCSFSRWMKI